MLLIILCIWIIICFITNVYVKDKLSKLISNFYVFFMSITITLSILNPFNYYPVKFQTYLFITLASLGFICGFLLWGSGKNYKFSNIKSFQLKNIIKKISESNILIILSVVSTAFMIPFDILVLSMENGNDIQYVIQELFTKSSNYFVYSYFVFPLKNFCNVTICYCIIKYKRQYVLRILIFASQIISYCIVSGARGDIVNFFIYFLIVFICINPSKKFIQIRSKKFLALIAAGITCYFFLIIMTGYRTTGKFDMSYETVSEGTSVVNEMVISYCILPYQLLDIALNNDFYKKFDGPFYGNATFAGYITLINNSLKKFGIKVKTFDENIKFMNDNWLSISPSERKNFAYTASFLHYMDFGILGVFFIPLFFGIVFRKFVLFFYRYESFPLFLLICQCFLMMKSSIFICYFLIPYQAFYTAILLIWFIIDLCKPKIRSKNHRFNIQHLYINN